MVDSSKCFGAQPPQFKGSRLMFISNLLDRVESTGWGSGNYSNHNWGGRFNESDRITNFTWGASVDPQSAYLPRSPVNTFSARCCVRDDFLFCRCQERLWRQYSRLDPLVSPRVHRRGKDMDSTVTKYFLFKIPVASVIKCFVTVYSVIHCFRIACKITLCVTCCCCA